MFDSITPVTLSTKAAVEVCKIMKKKDIPSVYGLRLGVRGGGCGGPVFFLGFDKKKKTDLSYFLGDLFILIDKKDMLYVVGKEIDFYDENDHQGFRVIDPSS